MLKTKLNYILYFNFNYFFKLVLFIFCYIVLRSNPVLLQQNPGEVEYRLKAVYLFNFLQFIEWPANVYENEESPVVVGIFGKDPFEKIIDETFSAEKAGSHPIQIIRFRKLEEMSSCHVLFISSSEKEISSASLKSLAESSILTVSDMENFAERGGSIGFYLENNKIKFEINMLALRQAQLKVSSKLMRLAKIINPT